MSKPYFKYRDLCARIQKIPESYHSTMVDIFIQHKCVINENKKGINWGVNVILDFIPDEALQDLEKRVAFIENIENRNTEIENARLALNHQNPEEAITATAATNAGHPHRAFISTGTNPFLSAPPTNGSHTLFSAPCPATSGSLAQKITQLKIKLYQNANMKHRSSATCFWCTLPIDQPTHVCIPTQIRANPPDESGDELYEMEGYGSFCRPECAAGYLMNETIETSLKLDRYMLLNQLYIPHSDLKQGVSVTGILPAVSPHYVMDKFLGTLTAEEYIKMTEGGTTFTILRKPFTHILPELHDNYIIEHN